MEKNKMENGKWSVIFVFYYWVIYVFGSIFHGNGEKIFSNFEIIEILNFDMMWSVETSRPGYPINNTLARWYKVQGDDLSLDCAQGAPQQQRP